MLRRSRSDLVTDKIPPITQLLKVQAIKAAYEMNHGMSLMRAVNKECSGTYRNVLLGCLFPTSEVMRNRCACKNERTTVV